MTDQKDFKITVSQKMAKIGRLGIAYARERINEPELSTVQYKVCVTIYNEPGLSQDAVSRELGMDKSSIAKLIAKLMTDDVVYRKTNPKDHREYQLYLTDKGQNLTQEFVNYLFEWEMTLCMNVGVDHSVIHEQLSAMLKAAEELAE